MTQPPAVAKKTKRALLYLRVSSQSQVDTDYDPEGNSIPTQRQACQRRAEELGYTVVDEYVEPGRSGRNTNRPRFNDMMKRVRSDQDVDCIIVYNRARLHRDAFDAALTKRELAGLGVELVSVMDYTAADPTGELIANIIDSINEYQSRMNGADVAIKMAAKAERGGTSGKCPLGYLNVREMVDGREVRTVIHDPDRADHIRYAFAEYATGRYSVKKLHTKVTEAGLRTRPSKSYPAGRVISENALGALLSNRYYIGYVTFKGQEFPGRHEPLVDPTVFERVQLVLAQQRWLGNRDRKWDHYLKGSIWCGRCSRRYILLKGTSARKRNYFYFICKGKQRNECDMPRLPIAQVEQAVAAHWATIAITEDEAAEIHDAIEAADTEFDQTVIQIKKQLRSQLRKITEAQRQCVDLLGDPDWPIEQLTERIADLKVQQAATESKLAEAENSPDLTAANDQIRTITELVRAPRRIYERAPEQDKKVLNQTCFTKLYIDTDTDNRAIVRRHESGPATKPYFDELLTTANTSSRSRKTKARVNRANGCTKRTLVGATGIEPVTTSL